MATVDRVLPWRRHAPQPAEEVASIVTAFHTHSPKASTTSITKAYELAAEAHEQQ
jgi:hypothetical protein